MRSISLDLTSLIDFQFRPPSRDGDLSFWNVGTPGRTVVIELTDERYRRLFLSVDEPRALVDTINAAAG